MPDKSFKQTSYKTPQRDINLRETNDKTQQPPVPKTSNITVLPIKLLTRKKGKNVQNKYRGDAIFKGAGNIHETYSTNQKGGA